jgi:hypothetical protein
MWGWSNGTLDCNERNVDWISFEKKSIGFGEGVYLLER